MGKQVILRRTIQQIVSERDRSLALARQGFDLLREADKAYRNAASDDGLGLFIGMQYGDWRSFNSDDRKDYDYDRVLEKLRKRIDSGAWEHIINSSGMKNLMDTTLEKKLRDQLRENPIPVSTDTVISTLEELYQNKDKTFRQAIVNIFKSFSDRSYRAINYKSNRAFSIGRRLIMSSCCSWSLALDYDHRNIISDLDRMLHVIQGLPQPGKANDAGSALELAISNQQKTVDTQFLHIKIFLNGNLHIYIKSDKLITKINEIIAEHFRQTLAHDRHN